MVSHDSRCIVDSLVSVRAASNLDSLANARSFRAKAAFAAVIAISM